MNSFYFVLIVAGFSFIQWLVKHLATQAEKRRQQQATQRAELEMLRTGRASEAISESPLSDPDARRRDELEELRRRAAARREPESSEKPDQSAISPLEILLGLPPGTTSGGTIAPSRTPRTPKPARTSKRQQERLRTQAARESARGRTEAAATAPAQPRPVPPSEWAEIRSIERAPAPTPIAQQGRPTETRTVARAPARPASLAGANVVPRSASEWRRAIVMNEVLSRPVSLR